MTDTTSSTTSGKSSGSSRGDRPGNGGSAPETSRATDRLDAGIAGLHVPEPKGDTEALLLKLGLLLPVVGLVLILLAFWNASETAFVADQIPMLISGGILGLALVVIGLGLFIRFSMARLLRFWLARLVLEQEVQTTRVVEALARVERASHHERSIHVDGRPPHVE